MFLVWIEYNLARIIAHSISHRGSTAKSHLYVGRTTCYQGSCFLINPKANILRNTRLVIG